MNHKSQVVHTTCTARAQYGIFKVLIPGPPRKSFTQFYLGLLIFAVFLVIC